MKHITKTALKGLLLTLLMVANSVNAAVPANYVAKYLIQGNAEDGALQLNKIDSADGNITSYIASSLNGYTPLGYNTTDERLYLFEKNGGNQYKSCGISSTGQLACNPHTLPPVINYEAGISKVKFNVEGDLAYISSSEKIQVCTLTSLDGSLGSCTTLLNAPMNGSIDNIEIASPNGQAMLYYAQSGTSDGIYSCRVSTSGIQVSGCVRGGPITVYGYPIVVDSLEGELYTGNSSHQLIRYKLNTANNSVPSGGIIIRTVANAELTGLAINERNNILYTMFSNSTTGSTTALECSLILNSCNGIVGSQYSRGNIWVSYSKP